MKNGENEMHNFGMAQATRLEFDANCIMVPVA